MAEQRAPAVMMEEIVSLDYTTLATDVGMRFMECLVEGRIVGHKSRESGLVYVPPKGYCLMTGTPTTAEDEVEVSDRGVVTGFTIIEPIQYPGQEETERYVQAQVLLDGASSALGLCRIEEIPFDEVRAGLRVKAVWYPPAERRSTIVDSWGGRAIATCIRHWVPSGEPDAEPASIAKSMF